MKKVLVVEDNHDLREVLVLGLEYLGYSTVEASNGQEAKAYLSSNDEVDIIISDVNMPKMNGGVFKMVQRK